MIMNAKTLFSLFFSLILGFSGCQDPTPPLLLSSEKQPDTGSKVPPYVLQTLEHIERYQSAPEGYVGGRTFENREKRLPLASPTGIRIHYKEWDVHPRIRGKNRGPERLVTGSDRSAWFTADHYNTFIQLK